MSLRRFLAVPVLALVALPAVVAGCGSDSKGSSATTTIAGAATTAAGAGTTAAGTAAGGDKITVADFAFSPPTLTVKAGSTVTVTNEQGVTHTITADDAKAFNEPLEADATVELKLDTAGSYPYHCAIHTDMKGTITVEA